MTSTANSKELPSGWTAKFNPEFQVNQYIDESTGKVHFLHPSAPAPPKVSSPWTSKADKKGRIYYENHDTRSTSWKNPIDEEHLLARKNELKDEDWKIGYWVDRPGGNEWWVNYKTGKLSWSTDWKEGDEQDACHPEQ